MDENVDEHVDRHVDEHVDEQKWMDILMNMFLHTRVDLLIDMWTKCE